ncbi:MAG: hypothetical protein GX621_14845 [Pirellulaceae bacterium]|nr:hypothetical protein [Pirellulaceae bacterium]
MGPDAFNEFLFDTGANSIVVFGYATSELEANGFEIEGEFEEQGVGGFVTYDVSASYGFQFAGTDGMEQTLTDVRVLSSQTSDPGSVGSFMGIAGMPIMVNRVTTLNHQGWSGGLLPDVSNLFMGVAFSPDLPPDQGHRYSVSVTPMPFGPHGEDPLPIWAPVPFVAATAQVGSNRATGSFLFDTGAQMSMLSSETAIHAGLDSNGDGVLNNLDDNYLYTEVVGGIGSSTEVPVFNVDSLRLPTNEGVELVWTDASVIIIDIHPDIEGIIGSDLLTSGWVNALFFGGADGYINQVQLDFRGMMDPANPTGTIYFDLNPTVDHVIYPPTPNIPGDANGDRRVDAEDAAILASYWGQSVLGGAAQGDFNGDGIVDAADAAIQAANFGYVPAIPGDTNGNGYVDDQDAATLASYWGQSVTGGAAYGDFNGDGFVNSADAAILAANWSPAAGESAATIPEPATPTLLLLAATVALTSRRRYTLAYC